ncbi:hypothetical protein J6590_088131 [Homalodisca vitripennis]|nr:hypothetical protein J6590_088131 [Homalodisca vitripennis]
MADVKISYDCNQLLYTFIVIVTYKTNLIYLLTLSQIPWSYMQHDLTQCCSYVTDFATTQAIENLFRGQGVRELGHGAIERSLKQPYAIKFCVQLGKHAEETYQMLRGLGGGMHFEGSMKEVAPQSSPKPKIARLNKSRIQTMLIVFVDVRGNVYFVFILQRQILNSAFYLEVIKRLKRRVVRVRTEISTSSSPTSTIPSVTRSSSPPITSPVTRPP